MIELNMVKGIYRFHLCDKTTFKFTWWTTGVGGNNSIKETIIGNIEFPRQVVRDFKKRYPEGKINYRDEYKEI